MLARDFGPRVVGKIEAAMSRQPYLTTGATQSPEEVIRHYVAVAKGSQLLDSGAIARLEKLSAEFETKPDQGEFFNQEIRPYLLALTPERRK
jgi:hypothetical protein